MPRPHQSFDLLHKKHRHRMCDYFAVCGLPDQPHIESTITLADFHSIGDHCSNLGAAPPLPHPQSSSSICSTPSVASPLSPRGQANAAALAQQQFMMRYQDIMGIALHYPDEMLPPGYILLTQTINGNRANLDSYKGGSNGTGGIYLAYRRRMPHEVGPAIAEIVILGKGEVLPVDKGAGYELINRTAAGRLYAPQRGEGPMLLIRRQCYDAGHRYYEDRAVTHLCLLSNTNRLSNTATTTTSSLEATYLGSSSSTTSSSSPLTSAATSLLHLPLTSSSSSASSHTNATAAGGNSSRGVGVGVGVGSNKTEAASVEAEGYHILEENIAFKAIGWTGTNSKHKLYLAYKTSPLALGLCEGTFKAEVLDHFPSREHRDFALPREVISMFSYPKGIHLQRVREDDPPEPSYSSYVLTDEHGRNYFIGSLTMWEPMNEEMVASTEMALRKEALHRKGRLEVHYDAVVRRCKQVESKQEDEQEEGGGAAEEEGGTEDEGGEAAAAAGRRNRGKRRSVRYLLMAPKVLVVVSHWPIFRFMKKWLSQLYVLIMTQNRVPLERCIEHFVNQVPLPEVGGIPIALRINDMMDPIILSRPASQGLPFLDLSFSSLFTCLDIGNVLTVIALLLQERKVLVVCKYESLLNEVMEACRALLFPFQWESCYVTRLTESMVDCVDFPGGFFLGVKDDLNEKTGAPDSSLLAIQQVLAETPTGAPDSSLLSIQQVLAEVDDVILVDLTRNLVTSASARLPVTFKSLPSKLRHTLQHRWSLTLAEAGIQPGSGFSKGFNPDHTLEYTSSSRNPPLSARGGVDGYSNNNSNSNSSLNDRAIRDAVLCFMLSLMKGYRDFLVTPDLNHGYREIFDKKGFVKSTDKHHRSFVDKMMATQLFSSFIQRRTEASDPHLLFFDHCMTLYTLHPETYDQLLPLPSPSAPSALSLSTTFGSTIGSSDSSSSNSNASTAGNMVIGTQPPVPTSTSRLIPPSARTAATTVGHSLLIDRVESMANTDNPSSASSASPRLMQRMLSSSPSFHNTPRNMLSSSPSFHNTPRSMLCSSPSFASSSTRTMLSSPSFSNTATLTSSSSPMMRLTRSGTPLMVKTTGGVVAAAAAAAGEGDEDGTSRTTNTLPTTTDATTPPTATTTTTVGNVSSQEGRKEGRCDSPASSIGPSGGRKPAIPTLNLAFSSPTLLTTTANGVNNEGGKGHCDSPASSTRPSSGRMPVIPTLNLASSPPTTTPNITGVSSQEDRCTSPASSTRPSSGRKPVIPTLNLPSSIVPPSTTPTTTNDDVSSQGGGRGGRCNSPASFTGTGGGGGGRWGKVKSSLPLLSSAKSAGFNSPRLMGGQQQSPRGGLAGLGTDDTSSSDIVDGMKELRPSVEGLPVDKLYSYCDNGYVAWPKKLDESLFTGVKLTKEEAGDDNEGDEENRGDSTATDGHLAGLLLTRTQMEIMQDEMDLSHEGQVKYEGGEQVIMTGDCLFQPVKRMGLHFFGTWFMCIPMLVKCAHEDDEKEDLIVRAFGALASMRGERQLIPDETIYRALLIACIRGGANCRSDAVRLLKELKELGIIPNAITYGQYMKAIASAGYDRWNTPSASNNNSSAAAEEVSPQEDFAYLLERLPSIYLSILDPTRKELWEKGNEWRAGIEVGYAIRRRRESGVGGEKGATTTSHPQHYPSLAGPSGDKGVSTLIPTFSKAYSPISTSWSMALPSKTKDFSDNTSLQQVSSTYAVVSMWSGLPHFLSSSEEGEDDGYEYDEEEFDGVEFDLLEGDEGEGEEEEEGGRRGGGQRGVRACCAAMTLDEEIMAGWGRQQREEAGEPGWYTCRQCHRSFLPQIHIQCKALASEPLEKMFGQDTPVIRRDGGSKGGLCIGSDVTTTPAATAAGGLAVDEAARRTVASVAKLLVLQRQAIASRSGNAAQDDDHDEEEEEEEEEESCSLFDLEPAFASGSTSSRQQNDKKEEGETSEFLPVYQTMTISVPYMSPAMLRVSLEQLIQEGGEAALYRSAVLHLCPELFWNLWWYCARFDLPLPLPVHEKDDSIQLVMIAGWDHNIVMKASQAALLTLHSLKEDRVVEKLHNKIEEASQLAAAKAAKEAALAAQSKAPSMFTFDDAALLSSSDHDDEQNGGIAAQKEAEEPLDLIKKISHEIHAERYAIFANSLASVLHEYFRNEAFHQTTDTPTGQLCFSIAAGLKAGNLTAAMNFFVAQRQKEESGLGLFTHSLYQVFLYYITRFPSCVTKIDGEEMQRKKVDTCMSVMMDAPNNRGRQTVVGACQSGYHGSCPAGTSDSVKADFDKIFLKSWADLSQESKEMLQEADQMPSDEALAARSVFGHLY